VLFIIQHYYKRKWEFDSMNRKIQKELEAQDRNTEALKLKKARFGNLREQLSYGWSSGLILDIVINLIFPYPGWDYIIVPAQLLNQYNMRVPYFVSSWLLIIMVFRIRTINVFQSEKFFSDLYSQTICQLHGVKQSRLYMIKMILV